MAVCFPCDQSGLLLLYLLLLHRHTHRGWPACGTAVFHHQGKLEILVRKFMPSSRARRTPRGRGPPLASIRFFAIESR